MLGSPDSPTVTLQIDIPRQRIGAMLTQYLEQTREAVDKGITDAIAGFDYNAAAKKAVETEMTRAINGAVMDYLRLGQGGQTVTMTVAEIMAPILNAVLDAYKPAAPAGQPADQPIGNPSGPDGPTYCYGRDDIVETWRFTLRSALIEMLGNKVAPGTDLIAIGNALADMLLEHWTFKALR